MCGACHEQDPTNQGINIANDGIFQMRNPTKKKEASISDLSYYTYLREVEYQVLAHFEWNMNNESLTFDRNENKHHNVAKRSVIKGGRRDIFLGTRECQGYVEPCRFGEGTSFYDGYGEIDFGVMFHGFDYPSDTGKDELGRRLWRAKMNDGVIEFPRPDNFGVVREHIRPLNQKQFQPGIDFSLIDDDYLLADLMKEDSK